MVKVINETINITETSGTLKTIVRVTNEVVNVTESYQLYRTKEFFKGLLRWVN